MPTATDNRTLYASLAGLLDYPGSDYSDRAWRCRDLLAAGHPQASELIARFIARINGETPESLEEAYTRTFDLAPTCIPYVTSYICGEENFERGKLMAGLSDAYARLGFDTGGELPDHLAVLLRFTRHLDEAEVNDLIEFCLAKPVAEMAERLEAADNLFAPVLAAINAVLRSTTAEETCDA